MFHGENHQFQTAKIKIKFLSIKKRPAKNHHYKLRIQKAFFQGVKK